MEVSRNIMWPLSHLTVILVNTGSSIGHESLCSADEFINTSVQLCQACPVLHKQVHSGLWVKCILVSRHSSLKTSYEQKQSASLQFVAEVTSSEFKYTHPVNNEGHTCFPRQGSSERVREHLDFQK